MSNAAYSKAYIKAQSEDANCQISQYLTPGVRLIFRRKKKVIIPIIPPKRRRIKRGLTR
jgi:hypothetical protein